jgi:tagatose 1,6-diphosphate aldolase
MPQSFQYLDPGPLVEGELELIRPEERWVEALLAACHHPLTVRLEPGMAATTRQQAVAFVENHPGGLGPLNAMGEPPPTYHFWMRTHGQEAAALIAGGIALRIGHSADLEQYVGHIGYHVYPPARGRHYAERACRLLLPLARRHGINPLWITCNPDNIPSRRTCERLGAVLVNVVDLPADHSLRAAGDRRKCRYRLDL